jgi:hypothetical protein
MRRGGWVKTEEDPQDLREGTVAQPGMMAIRHVEEAVVRAGGAVLQYGWLYGPGSTDDTVDLMRKRQLPRVRGGASHTSWVIWTTRRAPQSWPWSRRRGACSTSSTTNRPLPSNGALPGCVYGRKAADAGPRVAGLDTGRGAGGEGDAS